MAEGRDPGNLSPLEEQYLHESEPNDDDLELQLQGEKELASQKLWQTFQESATAVAHLFRGRLNSLSLPSPPPPSFSLPLPSPLSLSPSPSLFLMFTSSSLSLVSLLFYFLLFHVIRLSTTSWAGCLGSLS